MKNFVDMLLVRYSFVTYISNIFLILRQTTFVHLFLQLLLRIVLLIWEIQALNKFLWLDTTTRSKMNIFVIGNNHTQN